MGFFFFLSLHQARRIPEYYKGILPGSRFLALEFDYEKYFSFGYSVLAHGFGEQTCLGEVRMKKFVL